MVPRFLDLCRILHRASLPPPTVRLPSNPSIAAADEGWRCLVRTVNYRLAPNGGIALFLAPGHSTSANWDYCLADDLTVIGRRPVPDDDLRREHAQINQSGFEDARLFRWRGGWWLVASVADFTSGGRTVVVLAELGDEGEPRHFTALPSPFGQLIEKNWAPCVVGDDLYLVYRFSPLTVLRVEEGGRRLEPVDGPPGHPALAGWSGSSQLVDWRNGGRLAVIHRKHLVTNPLKQSLMIYEHRFVLLDPHWRVAAASQPFLFESWGVEFCAGLAVKGDRVALSYGVNDSQAIIVVTTAADVEAMLEAGAP